MGKTGASTLTSIECGNESVTCDAVNYVLSIVKFSNCLKKKKHF